MTAKTKNKKGAAKAAPSQEADEILFPRMKQAAEERKQKAALTRAETDMLSGLAPNATLEQRTMHLLSQFHVQQNITKLDIQESAKQFMKRADEEGIDKPLELLVAVRAMQEFCDCILFQSRERILDELGKYSKNEKITVRGVEIKKTSVPKKYEYGYDPRWLKLCATIQEATEKRKEREKFLQTIPEGESVVDAETGLLLSRAVYTGGGENYSVTIPQE